MAISNDKLHDAQDFARRPTKDLETRGRQQGWIDIKGSQGDDLREVCIEQWHPQFGGRMTRRSS